jgi:ribosomal protein S12 methylthiotransferase accessory factor
VDEDIRLILAHLAADGFEQAIVVDLTKSELGIPVGRVVVPGAEAWSVYYKHIRRARFGARASRALSGTMSGEINHASVSS